MKSIHDADEKLTGKARRRVMEHLADKKVQNPKCCEKPSLVPHFIFGEDTLTIDNIGGKSVVDRHGGVPTINLVCSSCGSMRAFLAGSIFPEWLDENAAPDKS